MTRGVLLMAYGTPENSEDVEAYLTHIRGGRAPTLDAVMALQRRYELVGGRTPLLDIAHAVRDALQRDLNARSTGESYRVYVGMKHWHPFIADVVRGMADDGISDLVALALAPHYSRISIGGYQKAVADAASEQRRPIALRLVNGWHLNAGFIALIAQRIEQALARWSPNERANIVTVFSAHSLPERIRQWSDPYEQQLLQSCGAVGARTGIDNWRFAWQSASDTGEVWLGPDIKNVLRALHRDGVRHVLSVPIGFVSDHLEIMYDIDHEARREAHALGMILNRITMPNADPAFIKVLASVVADAVSDSHAPREPVA